MYVEPAESSEYLDLILTRSEVLTNSMIFSVSLKSSLEIDKILFFAHSAQISIRN